MANRRHRETTFGKRWRSPGFQESAGARVAKRKRSRIGPGYSRHLDGFRALLTKVFSDEQFETALDSWQWIGLRGKQPVRGSLFGDLFFSSSDGWWFLDVIEGSLTRRWPDRTALERELAIEDGQDRYLLAGLALAAADRGLTLGPTEVYGFAVPPVLGGEMTVENVEKTDFDVALTIAGQLHQQVRDLPPGTRISEVRFDP
jgi:hypothetical protein